MGSFEVDDLVKSFGAGAPALDGVTFRYEGAGAIGYLGPNGAGKTTTLKLLVGLLRPTRGRALLNGFDPVADRVRALEDVGAVIETPEPYPTLTIYDTLRTVGELRGLAPADVDAEIDRCHRLLRLSELDARVGALSKGQRQRVVLASALLGDPSVLLLDEPTSGLDPAERVHVRDLLGRLKRDHLLFISSHQMVEVAEVCDEVIVLHRGRVLLKDRVDRVSSRIRSREVIVEFGRPVDRAALAPVRPLAEDLTAVSDRRWRVRFDGRDESRDRILAACLTVAPVVQFANASLVLEEAYLDAIGEGTGPRR
ncbi:MAG TPA: ABC transporter ATP-binding protein [Thermoplasmata archaeon]|nr:ABC transporter ATP-binding protein [Thermoplasmata archaeon]